MPSEGVCKFTALPDRSYIASESTFYRVLKSEGLQHKRGRSRERQNRSQPVSYTAEGPNQVWSWDITYLPSQVKGQFYYLYMHKDLFSRKIVGYEVHNMECGELAAQLLQRNILREQCSANPPVLHSDNGAPMKALTMKAKMEELGVMRSYSRPGVSNDNPFVESLFRTLKYCPQWPSHGFDSLEAARDWVQSFVNWYNNEHKHSRLNFVTPASRHKRQDTKILAKRKQVLEEVRSKNPQRWSGRVRNCTPVSSVTLNPRKDRTIEEKRAA